MQSKAIPLHHRLHEQREGLLELIKKCEDCRIICQVGVALGDDTELWIEDNPNRIIFCVDPWCFDNVSINYGPKGYEKFIDKFKSYPNVIPIKLFSKEASVLFNDNFFDLVYIDAGHTYSNVRDDLSYWIPKVKNNGFIAGHDYIKCWPGVIKAVDERFPKIIKYIDSSWISKINHTDIFKTYR